MFLVLIQKAKFGYGMVLHSSPHILTKILIVNIKCGRNLAMHSGRDNLPADFIE